MIARTVFLDHLSATPLDPRVLAAMQPVFTETFGNPSSRHRHGLRARDLLGRAREQIALLIHAESPDEIIFTSGGAEANNLAIKGTAWANQRRGSHLIISATEHPNVFESVAFLEKHGFTCSRVRVNTQGIVDPQDVADAITGQTILIAIHHANHDIGAVQPIAEIGKLAAAKGIAFFSDATASGGWLPVDVRKMKVNLLSLAPHRFYGPKGVGILYRNRRARLAPIIHGGDQEFGKRAGTENVAAIVGAGQAAELAGKEMPRRIRHVAALQRRLADGLLAKIPNLTLNGPPCGPLRSPVNLSVAMQSIEGESLLVMLDHQGICVASGTGCVTKSAKGPHVLNAIGLDRVLARSAITLTLGKDNTPDEIRYVIETMAAVVSRLRGA